MFLNGRLVIVAMLASVVAVSCGLGVFAAFRVNHQPFTRLQSADPPLQLVSGSGAPAPAKDMSAPFDVRFLLNLPVAVPEKAAPVSVQRPPPTAPEDAVPAPDSGAAAATPPAAVVEKPAAVAVISSDHESQRPAGLQAPTEIELPAKEAAGPDSKDPAVALIPPPDQMPKPVPAVPATTALTDNPAAAAAKPRVLPSGKAKAKAAAKRRVVKMRRFRRIPPDDAAQFAIQPFPFAPAYPDAMPPPVVRRRVVVKRHRPTAKAVTQAPAEQQTTANGPALAASKR